MYQKIDRMLITNYTENEIEAGCDEAGRGCLAGPVFAASVILPKNFNHNLLNDSKKVTAKNRIILREIIEKEAISFAVCKTDCKIIDEINILNASILTMHKAIEKLNIIPTLLLIDGNRFKPFKNINHICIIKGDEKYTSIAAASILAKTYRDDYMRLIHSDFPKYNWLKNKGYGTFEHQKAILENGKTEHHRKTFNFKLQQTSIGF